MARRESRTDELPRLPTRRPAVDVTRAVLLVRRAGCVLLRRRRSEELLPGLWDLPGAFTGTDGDRSSGQDHAARLVPFPVEIGAPLGTIRHGITYRRITLEVHEARSARRAPRRGDLRGPDGAELTWSEPSAALDRALSSPARRILARWGESP